MINGTVTLHRQYGLWLIKCEPHVAIRLKRLFSRIGRDETGHFTLSDTLESSYDLSWFIDRYPMEMLPGDRTYLDERVAAYNAQGIMIDGMLDGSVEADPYQLAKPARPYQRITPAMTLELGGLLCADEIGLGKTIEAICCFTDQRTLPAVVVTLSDLPSQWAEKCEEFAPQLSTHIIRGITPYDLTQLRHSTNGAQGTLTAAMPDVIIMNYEKLSGWAETLAKFAKMVVWDEVQELRTGPGTLKYEAAKHLAESVDFRLGLSATPIYNYGGEFFNVMACLRPDALGTREEFLQEWCKGRSSKSALIAKPKAFGQYLRTAGLMIKRTAKEVGMELPGGGKPLIIPHIIGTDSAVLNAVSTSCAELAKLIIQQGEAFKGQKRAAAKEFNMKIRQATGIAKAPFVGDFLRMLVESGEKPVLFGWHRGFWDILLERLKDLKPAMWTGTESHAQKAENKRRFVSGETSLFFCSLRAGAGLDGLQFNSRIVVVGELDYSPEVHKQNIGRVFRAGQEDIVRAYFLYAEAGSDPVLTDILGLKKFQIEGVMQPELDLEKEDTQLDPDHMKRLAEGYLAQLAQAAAANTLNSSQAKLRTRN